jgi:hypothetical protein
MKLDVTLAALVAVALIAPPAARAQGTDTPPSASAPASRTDQPTEQAQAPELEASFGVQSGAPSAGSRTVVPWAARGDNTAFRPAAPDGAVSK